MIAINSNMTMHQKALILGDSKKHNKQKAVMSGNTHTGYEHGVEFPPRNDIGRKKVKHRGEHEDVVVQRPKTGEELALEVIKRALGEGNSKVYHSLVAKHTLNKKRMQAARKNLSRSGEKHMPVSWTVDSWALFAQWEQDTLHNPPRGVVSLRQQFPNVEISYEARSDDFLRSHPKSTRPERKFGEIYNIGGIPFGYFIQMKKAAQKSGGKLEQHQYSSGWALTPQLSDFLRVVRGDSQPEYSEDQRLAQKQYVEARLARVIPPVPASRHPASYVGRGRNFARKFGPGYSSDNSGDGPDYGPPLPPGFQHQRKQVECAVCLTSGTSPDYAKSCPACTIVLCVLCRLRLVYEHHRHCPGCRLGKLWRERLLAFNKCLGIVIYAVEDETGYYWACSSNANDYTGKIIWPDLPMGPEYSSDVAGDGPENCKRRCAVHYHNKNKVGAERRLAEKTSKKKPDAGKRKQACEEGMTCNNPEHYHLGSHQDIETVLGNLLYTEVGCESIERVVEATQQLVEDIQSDEAASEAVKRRLMFKAGAYSGKKCVCCSEKRCNVALALAVENKWCTLLDIQNHCLAENSPPEPVVNSEGMEPRVSYDFAVDMGLVEDTRPTLREQAIADGTLPEHLLRKEKGVEKAKNKERKLRASFIADAAYNHIPPPSPAEAQLELMFVMNNFSLLDSLDATEIGNVILWQRVSNHGALAMSDDEILASLTHHRETGGAHVSDGEDIAPDLEMDEHTSQERQAGESAPPLDGTAVIIEEGQIVVPQITESPAHPLAENIPAIEDFGLTEVMGESIYGALPEDCVTHVCGVSSADTASEAPGVAGVRLAKSRAEKITHNLLQMRSVKDLRKSLANAPEGTVTAIELTRLGKKEQVCLNVIKALVAQESTEADTACVPGETGTQVGPTSRGDAGDVMPPLADSDSEDEEEENTPAPTPSSAPPPIPPEVTGESPELLNVFAELGVMVNNPLLASTAFVGPALPPKNKDGGQAYAIQHKGRVTVLANLMASKLPGKDRRDATFAYYFLQNGENRFLHNGVEVIAVPPGRYPLIHDDKTGLLYLCPQNITREFSADWFSHTLDGEWDEGENATVEVLVSDWMLTCRNQLKCNMQYTGSDSDQASLVRWYERFFNDQVFGNIRNQHRIELYADFVAYITDISKKVLFVRNPSKKILQKANGSLVDNKISADYRDLQNSPIVRSSNALVINHGKYVVRRGVNCAEKDWHVLHDTIILHKVKGRVLHTYLPGQDGPKLQRVHLSIECEKWYTSHFMQFVGVDEMNRFQTFGPSALNTQVGMARVAGNLKGDTSLPQYYNQLHLIASVWHLFSKAEAKLLQKTLKFKIDMPKRERTSTGAYAKTVGILKPKGVWVKQKVDPEKPDGEYVAFSESHLWSDFDVFADRHRQRGFFEKLYSIFIQDPGRFVKSSFAHAVAFGYDYFNRAMDMVVSAELTHSTRKLRVHFCAENWVKFEQNLDIHCEKLQAKLKEEPAKPDTATKSAIPRFTVSYGGGCLDAPQAVTFAKKSLSGGRYFGTVNICGKNVAALCYSMVCPSPDDEAGLLEAVEQLLATNNMALLISFSDDSLTLFNDAGALRIIEVDIEKCDASQRLGLAVYMLGCFQRTSPYAFRDLLGIMKQGTVPIEIRNPECPDHTYEVIGAHFVMGSGILITTLCNETSVQSTFFVALRLMESLQTDDIIAALRHAYSLGGHTISVAIRDDLPQAQFLKRSFLRDTTGKLALVQNYGCVLRTWGSTQGDVTPEKAGLTKEEFRELIKAKQHSVINAHVMHQRVAGLCNEPGSTFMDALRTRFLLPEKEKRYIDPSRQHKYADVDRSMQRISDEELSRRYTRLTPADWNDMAQLILNSRDFTETRHFGFGHFLTVDYGYPSEENFLPKYTY